MPREKKNKIRKDKRYRRRYKGKEFYSYISDEDAKAKRDEYKRQEQLGFIKSQTVAEYALPWLERSFPAITETTYHANAIKLQHLIDNIGNKKISEVKPSDIKGIYSDHFRNLSNGYIQSSKQLYCALFDSAFADGLCRYNPARDKTAKPHKGYKPKERILTQQQRQWIETLCTDHRAYPAVMTMLYAGLRPQEVKAINIDRDVDFEKNTITVQETVHLNGKKYDFSDEMKTDWSKRVIPLFPPLKKALEGRTGYLVTKANGELLTVQAWISIWDSYKFCMETAINGMHKQWYKKTKAHKKILAEAEQLRKEGKIKEAEEKEGGIPDWIEFDIVPYTLRHAYCQFLRDSGVELNTARTWMGHADAKMILKVYDAVSIDRSEQERKKVENLLIGGHNGGQNENEKLGGVEK